jgi:hypothetical protein
MLSSPSEWCCDRLTAAKQFSGRLTATGLATRQLIPRAAGELI